MHTISVIGLGKLGLCMAACMAYKGYRVIGVDIDSAKVNLVNQGCSPLSETGLGQLVKETQGRLIATSDIERAVAASDATFIVVATPSLADGSYSNAQVEIASQMIGQALRKKDSFHVIALTSTIMPGTTENVVKPILEEMSGKRCGDSFSLVYNPEFIALGSVIRDFLNPDFILIGEMYPRSRDYLAAFYKRVCDNDPPIARMSAINAEITKLALNCYVTTKITFANTLAEVCEHTSGTNVDTITKALGLDTRIGPQYLRGGLGFGGPCFPRDNRAFRAFAKRVGCEAKLATTVDEINSDQVERIVELVKKRAGFGVTVAILGLSYKPNTSVVEDSQPIEIARKLSEFGVKVSVYDPMAIDNARHLLGSKVRYACSVEDCLRGVEICILATPWDEFRSLPATTFTSTMQNSIVIDCWRILQGLDFGELEYIAMGLG